MVILRPYQIQAKEAVKADFAAGLRRVGVSLPTGVGKSVIMASMAADVFAKGRRVIVLVHRDTLVDQTRRHLARVIPERAIGIVKAGKNDITAPVIVASIHTLRSEARLAQILPPDLTVVDEAHVSVSDTYLRYFEHIDAVEGGRGYLAGFTATWVRSDTRGLGDVWQKISYKKSLAWAVNHDPPYLVEPRAIQLGGDLDFSQVRTGIDGDYLEKDLAELVMIPDLKDTVVKGYNNLTPGHSAVLFAPTQQSARFFGDALKESGVRVAEIFAGTSPTERRYNFSAYENGAVQVLITCVALAEGFDCPKCDVALMLRPSKHPGLITQQIGRILRPWPGKQFATILDFVGVLDNADMRSIIDLSETPERVASDTAEQSELEPKESTPDPRMAKKIDGVHTIDLFAGTQARWLTTKHGVPFVNTRDHLYFVAQLDGNWAVGRCSSKSIQGGCWLIKGLTSAEALEHGSEAALEEDSSIAGRKSSWRQGNQRPSAGQLQMAQGMGIDTEGMNKADVSDAINVHRATQILANINGGGQ
jgi:superfamily II DNA or RNA helicase